MNLDIEILKFLESKTFERSKYKKRTFDDWKRLYKRFGFRYPSFKVRVEKCEYIMASSIIWNSTDVKIYKDIYP